MNLEQLLRALKARYRIVLVTLAVTVAVAFGASLLLPRMYTATTAVVVDVKYADPIAGSILPALTQPSYMATQLDIIQSDRVAGRVVKDLKLDEQPGIRDRWMDRTEGRGTLVTWLAAGLRGRLDVKPGKDSNVILVAFRDPDPQRAALIANTFARAYIDTSIELRVQPARQYSAYFVEQAQAARDRLEKAQSALSGYQQEHQLIVVNDDRMDIETSRLGELSSQYSAIQAQRAESKGRDAQARSAGGSIQEVLTSPLVQGLKSELARKESQLSQMSGNLGPNNPQFQRAQSEVAALRQKVNAESGSLAAGVATSDRVVAQREGEIKGLLDAQKARILRLKQDRDSAAVLQRDVDAAQKALDTVSQRQTQSNLESQTTQSNIAVLSPAIEPSRPSSPKMEINLLLALVAGAMLGIGAALMLEFMDRRVRSISDLSDALRLPVLGVLGGPGREPGFIAQLSWQRKTPRLAAPGATGR